MRPTIIDSQKWSSLIEAPAKKRATKTSHSPAGQRSSSIKLISVALQPKSSRLVRYLWSTIYKYIYVYKGGIP